MTALAYLGLGANLGRPREQIETALLRLQSDRSLTELTASSFYVTEYVGPGEQPDYLNLCVRGRTQLTARQLHDRTRDLEHEIEGGARQHLAPRRLDIDLLLFDDAVDESPDLRIPHPRLRDRRFVLEPLVELDHELRLPPDGVLARELLAAPGVAGQRVQRVDAGEPRRGGVE